MYLFLDLALHLDMRIIYAHNYNMTAKEVLKLLHKDGCYEVTQRSSHIQMRHPKKLGKVSVTSYKGDLPKSTLHSIFKQAGLKIERG